MRVLVAMSGGVDSSVAAALLRDQGHEVVGVTLKLWGGETSSGCCSVADVEDARGVTRRLGLDHLVFNLTDAFEEAVVGPYVAAHAAGETPNPCIECNRHVKFGLLLRRARRLGFDAVATGHHARVAVDPASGRHSLLRGRDPAKDQSYVLSMLTSAELAQVLLPVGELLKEEVRRLAAELGLQVAAKPDSQDVCFVASRAAEPGARARFVGARVPLHAGRVVDARTGEELGSVPAVELVTIGQRRGLGTGAGRGADAGDGAGGGAGGGSGGGSGQRAGGGSRSGRRYVVGVDLAGARVLVGEREDLLTDEVRLVRRTWAHEPAQEGTPVEVQASAHGAPRPAVLTDGGARLLEPAPRVAPGQTVALYAGEEVLGSGVAA